MVTAGSPDTWETRWMSATETVNASPAPATRATVGPSSVSRSSRTWPSTTATAPAARSWSWKPVSSPSRQRTSHTATCSVRISSSWRGPSGGAPPKRPARPSSRRLGRDLRLHRAVAVGGVPAERAREPQHHLVVGVDVHEEPVHAPARGDSADDLDQRAAESAALEGVNDADREVGRRGVGGVPDVAHDADGAALVEGDHGDVAVVVDGHQRIERPLGEPRQRREEAQEARLRGEPLERVGHELAILGHERADVHRLAGPKPHVDRIGEAGEAGAGRHAGNDGARTYGS